MLVQAAVRLRIGAAIFALCGLALTAAPVRAQDLIVFAAASLKESLDQVAQTFQRANRQKVVVAYASSSALARQIENGAPADIFISADQDWMDYLATRRLIDAATRADLVRNRLVLIAPADSKAKIDITPGFALAKLLGEGRLAIADPDHVPAGKYGRAALAKLGVWKSVENRLARAENVRAALIFVARGETPLGIVYQTDAYAEKKVRVIAQFPADTHPPIVYPVAVTAASKHPSAASFMSFLKAPEARAIFERFGFTMGR